MKRYTLIFIFNHLKSHVVLMKKVRPAWQQGLFNGVGGKIEKNEKPDDCILRETYEETGLFLIKDRLDLFGKLTDDGCEVWECYCYAYVIGEKRIEGEPMTRTDEEVHWVPCSALDMANVPVVPNLKFLIPMARHEAKKIDVTIKYKDDE